VRYLNKKELKPVEMSTPRANKIKKLAKISKVPIIKQLIRKRMYPNGIETQTGSPIPVNISLGSYEDQVLHHKVTEYFINKAGSIVLMDCPCRHACGCENHNIELGCTWLGRGASEMDISKFPGARLATKEEALEREWLAYEDGLIPHIGKFRSDAVHYGVLDCENEFMSICHCCSCCCIVALSKYGSSDWKKMIKRMEGVIVSIDPEKCTGCGICFKVCIYDGLRMKKDKAEIKQDNCMGCGRCEKVCPNGSISITIDDFSRIDELVARFEERVDISG
jgi:NAD-dependent dihydropyrimidine dehydrogenase PreA subunit